MSSHHIVREKQEPALLILGMDYFDPELLGQLLEWSPTVIATLQVAEKLNSLEIKVDRVISETTLGNLQSDVKHIPINGDKALQAALQFLVSEGYMAVNIVTDEFALTDYEPLVTQINLVLYNQHKKI